MTNPLTAASHRALSLAVAIAATVAIAGAAAWWHTAPAVAACHTWVGGLAYGLDGTTARDCQLAGLAHSAGTFGFWAGLLVAAVAAWELSRRGWSPPPQS